LTDLLSVTEAQKRITDVFHAMPMEKVGLIKAAGRVLAVDIKATNDLPPFPNSSMDGYAVRANDVHTASLESPVFLEVIEEIPAGYLPKEEINAGQTARIMTGAQIPTGADAVVPLENTGQPIKSILPGNSEIVPIFHTPKIGEYVRPRGQSVKNGDMVLTAGRKITPQDLGLLASFGISEVPVFRHPRVALLTTGDELISPEEPLEAGKIRDSNSYTLAALIEQHGGEVIRLGIAPDDRLVIREHLDRAISMNVDLILSSAGVSVGTYDYVKAIIEESGELAFWRVKMRPGKPLAFGHYRDVPFIGLPGNPVSAFVGFLVFVIPALNKMGGINKTQRLTQRAYLSHAIEADGRETYFRATVKLENHRFTASLTGHQGSDNIFALTQANALLIIPSGVKSLPIGSEVNFWLLNGEELS
jgi:molybdopterin molybdotransferase